MDSSIHVQILTLGKVSQIIFSKKMNLENSRVINEIMLMILSFNNMTTSIRVISK